LTYVHVCQYCHLHAKQQTQALAELRALAVANTVQQLQAVEQAVEELVQQDEVQNTDEGELQVKEDEEYGSNGGFEGTQIDVPCDNNTVYTATTTTRTLTVTQVCTVTRCTHDMLYLCAIDANTAYTSGVLPCTCMINPDMHACMPFSLQVTADVSMLSAYKKSRCSC
jgi:hypothetical protein